ncbi:helix-turn-helix domain-containing protein [Heyndrickxia sp. NPDC080065]|uniref:helix-turn-helix domain-containing protein n=1 Tax=Heyndrickxia sp. NPDC080065 TaxID=3390568 RepID=UPI003CFCEF2A
MLGERIRNIRKQKKMTLEALAGDELTKGMLSLIENNKANPSMESLTYIARQLEVEVTDLLEEISSQELRKILDKAEKLFNMDLEKVNDKYQQLIQLIEPYTPKLSHGYESARLLDIYSRSLFRENKKGWQEISDRAAQMYEQMNLTSNRASIGIFRATVKFAKHDYIQSLEIFLKERTELETRHAYIDPMTRVDLDYNEAILQFAVGNVEDAHRVMESAMNYSKEHRIFYRIDDLYRLAAAHAFMSHDIEKKNYYTKKLKQYGEFAEDKYSILFHDLFHVMSLISEEKAYNEALELIDQQLLNLEMTESYKSYFFLEKGKALYGLGCFKDALIWLEKIKIPTYLHHPFDLSSFYLVESYEALCYLELGNRTKAIQAAEVAMQNIDPLPVSPYKEFIIETYNTIKEKPAEDL